MADSGAWRKLGSVVSDEGVLFDHGHAVGVAEDFPWGGTDDGEFSAEVAHVGVVVLGDGVVELAVFEHFGPDPAVDAASEMFDELAVDEGRDGFAGLVGVDGGLEGELVEVEFDEGQLVEPGTSG